MNLLPYHYSEAVPVSDIADTDRIDIDYFDTGSGCIADIHSVLNYTADNPVGFAEAADNPVVLAADSDSYCSVGYYFRLDCYNLP